MKRIVFLAISILFIVSLCAANANNLTGTVNKKPETPKNLKVEGSQDSKQKALQIKALWGEECEEILCEGMTEADYQQSKACRWIPLLTDGAEYKPIAINLATHTPYENFRTILSKLSRSKICKAYRSSILSTDGRNLYALEIGTGTENVILTAGLHAREISNPQFLIKFACKLVDLYEKGDSTTLALLSKRKVVILPCINPDGYTITLEGKAKIRNKKLYIAGMDAKKINELKSNANGVDINRNFPNYSAGTCWKGVPKTDMITTQPDCSYFPGKSLGMENETKVTMNFLDKYMPDARIFVDLHSAGRVIYAGKPHLSDQFNIMAYSLGKYMETQTNYLLLGIEEEQTGLGADGTITDYVAELAAGFQYNPLTGRLMPPNWKQGTLVRNYDTLKHNVSVLTIETIPNKIGVTTTKPTSEAQNTEWEKYKLYDALNSLISYSFDPQQADSLIITQKGGINTNSIPHQSNIKLSE